MWTQPVDAKVAGCAEPFYFHFCFGPESPQEKMVGSTAVARQLLREIADKLDAEHVPYAPRLHRREGANCKHSTPDKARMRSSCRLEAHATGMQCLLSKYVRQLT